ncbi:RNA-binding domain-containing protein [Acinetobacter sp. SA01]|uniref:RNA-binding domain-containing protein n=1 Tax=Acinetobacter sp. SA01 TaxID=1862567 RepID=UPI001409FB1F|nr:RNA-binding domain-containing protein [Acinetobacter sp. SA01]
MLETIKISALEAEKILELSEGHFLDFKSIRISPVKLTKAIAAFANAEGGELYIGIEDDPREWSGFENIEHANAHIQILDSLFPLGTDIEYEFLKSELQKGLVLKVIINKSRDLKSASDGKVYIRRGAQSLPIDDQGRLQSLRRDKGIISFETELVNCPLEVVTNSEEIIDFLLNVIPNAEPEVWLKKQMVIQNGKPTVLSILLFAEEPQAVLPKRTGLKIYKYKTSSEEGTRETLDFQPITIDGNVYNQVFNAVAETVKIVESVRLQTTDGLVQVKYPQEAIHEIITNALIHRDYSIAEDIHVRIFDNRVEVWSPGKLPAHITPENILTERFARNPGLVRLINKFPNPPNKDIGEGLNTAFESMRNLKLKMPEIIQEGNYVKVILKHEPLASPEESILIYLLNNKEIANRHAREVCFIKSENKMKRILQGLVQNGLLESVPGRTRYTAAYQLTGKGTETAKKL